MKKLITLIIVAALCLSCAMAEEQKLDIRWLTDEYFYPEIATAQGELEYGFFDSRAYVGKTVTYGETVKVHAYVDTQGVEQVRSFYGAPSNFSDSMARINEDGICFFVNKDGYILLKPLTEYSGVGNYGQSLIPVLKDGKYGYIDLNGEEKLPFIYDMATDFSEKYAAVKDSGSEKYRYINEYGKPAFEGSFDSASPFSMGLAPVEQGGKWGYINTKGKLVIPCSYYEARDFSDDVAMVKVNENDEKYSLIDKKGRKLFSASEKIGQFGDGIAPFFDGEAYGYVNKGGAIVIPPQFEKASRFNEGFAMVAQGGKVGILTLPEVNAPRITAPNMLTLAAGLIGLGTIAAVVAAAMYIHSKRNEKSEDEKQE